MTLQSDWLGSDPIFYNTCTGKISRNINEVIDIQNLEFHPEGLNNYLDYGYSVFGQTPVKGVQYLLPNSSLQYEKGGLTVVRQEDPAVGLLNKEGREEDVLAALHKSINEWAASSEGDIIIPTSGGFDSRLLNLLLDDKSRIRAFTYGISSNQSESEEVVKAKRIAGILGIRWEQIVLGEFHKYLDYWDEQYGASTHAHGMYHIEFYNQILQRTAPNRPLLSGIIGDAWSGNVGIRAIQKPDDLQYLGYSHGVSATSEASVLKSGSELKEAYFEEKRQLLQDNSYRVIEAMRFKLVLLSYLIRIPDSMGFKAWSPFLDISIATQMLNLPSHRKQDRQWQRDLFRKHGLNLEDLNLSFSTRNTLDYQGMQKVQFSPLSEDLLKEVVKPAYVAWINKRIDNGLLNKLKNTFYAIPKIGALGFSNDIMAAYYGYVTLKPIENLIKKRESLIDG
ncbi:asparagine synthetase B family protein [Pontibacter virosus]|uniref:asparagine synthase (glutamine-hydrolyzing) n=1 Tax=Pontibacter virosus TaxID=1765052 RepID=A0A2U1ARK5_9BACT|nr:asparagine synthase-related protein [Pontibacter virosus]PVY39032.1 asparagine synthase [Pontibacter virosus]